MKSTIRMIAASVLLAGAAVAGQASAASIDFNGANFELSLVSGSGTSWVVNYHADFSGYSPSNGGMTHIAWKFPGSGADIASVDLGTLDSTLSNAGGGTCGANGGANWVCFDVDPDVATSGEYDFNFNVVFSNAVDAGLADLGYSIKARFLDGNGKFAGLMSCAIDANGGVEGDGCSPGREVPIPGTLGLLGLGLSGLGLVRRRKAA